MMTHQKVDIPRISLFLTFAFGIAWTTALAIYLTGGLQNSPTLIPNTGITLALALLAIPYMWAPTLAHILTRLLTGEGWRHTYLRPQLKRVWFYWVAAWILPGIATVLGFILFFLLFPEYYDPALGNLRKLIETAAPTMEMTTGALWMIVVAQFTQAIILAPLINSLFTFGEEFGWRAYLQPKLMPLGGRCAMLLMGVIWGIWHWPVILMGHNYGLDYPGAPFLGPLAMVWFTMNLGIFLGWATLKANSVWPAVIGHAAINGIAGLGALLMHGTPNLILGPLPTGIIGGLGFTAIALVIFFHPHGLEEAAPTATIDNELIAKAANWP